MDFEQKYETRARAEGVAVIDPAPRAYDVMWILAIALNKTLTAINSGEDINGTGCGEVPGSLVPLENFTYRYLFSGVSVSRFSPIHRV